MIFKSSTFSRVVPSTRMCDELSMTHLSPRTSNYCARIATVRAKPTSSSSPSTKQSPWRPICSRRRRPAASFYSSI